MSKRPEEEAYEKEHTAQFEGLYTPEEVALNKELYSECMKVSPDFEKVEDLLRRGADPLGATAASGWGLLEHIYGEIIFDLSCEIEPGVKPGSEANLPKITELFVKYGMDVDHPKVPYDGDNSMNPLWVLAFLPNEFGTAALRILLDHGLSADSAAECWDHALFDHFNIVSYHPEEYTWVWKMIMLVASYERILSEDESVRHLTGPEHNKSDVRAFREWDGFEYEFLSDRDINIYEKKTGALYWRIRLSGKWEEN